MKKRKPNKKGASRAELRAENALLKAELLRAQRTNAKLMAKQIVARAHQQAREELGMAFCLPQPR